MSTIVDLYIGGCAVGGQVYNADLILRSPYEEPVPTLLVLRSAPDIEPITGTFTVTETPDAAAFEGGFDASEVATGTIDVTEAADLAAFAGTTPPLEPPPEEPEEPEDPDPEDPDPEDPDPEDPPPPPPPPPPPLVGAFTVTEAPDVAAFFVSNLGLTTRLVTIAAVESPDAAAFEATYSPKSVGVLDAVGAEDTATFAGGFYAYEGPGYLVVDGRSDLAAFAGESVYVVTGTLVAVETPDVGVFAVKSYEHFDADLLEETAVGSDNLPNTDLASSLDSRGIASETLGSSLDVDIIITETAVASKRLTSFFRISAGLAESVVGSDKLEAIVFADATETAIASDVLAAVYDRDLQDVAVGSDTLASNSVITGALSDTALAGDDLAVIFFGDATETAIASETLAGDAQDLSGLVDRAFGSDPLVSTLVVTERVLEEVASASDAVDSIWLADAEDVGITTDTLSADPVAASADLTDTAIASDALNGGLTVYADLLTDRALGSDALTSSSLTLIGVLSDTALGGDSLVESAQTVHVMNAETGAMSVYTFTPTLVGAAEFRGVLYLAGPEGLYALDAEQDDDGNVVWKMQTGFSDLGTDLLKRIQDVNVQARTAGNTVLEVTSDRYGTKQQYNYRVPPLTRDSYRDGVVKPGQGIQSVYYSLGLRGTGPAEIDQLRLVVTPLSRRR